MRKFLCLLALCLVACLDDTDSDITSLPDGRKVHHYHCGCEHDIHCQIKIGKKCPDGFEIIKHEMDDYLFICHDKFTNSTGNVK